MQTKTFLRAQAQSQVRQAMLAAARAVISTEGYAGLSMRRLANDLAGARGALNVGLVVTVTPKRAVDIRVHKDYQQIERFITASAPRQLQGQG